MQNDLWYYRLNPLVAKKKLNNGRHLHKNDRLNAQNLIKTKIIPGPLSFTKLKVPTYTKLADMIHFYEQLNEDTKQIRNRIHRIIQLSFATFTDKFGLTTSNAMEILKHYPNSELLRNKELTETEDELKR
ncbi:hypothetical protein [Weissella paramesenteroides]|uniref:hypothetical protein n=1 Tax=Weissella paramesenteroides TaxID=1249 RepID=UPI00123B273D|nr:hypothetical protein [Weissella paramesenteroides]KAA8456452.1 hypothetical protein FKV86_04170 [Weissella paramesenteroides]KAA8456604.1 hypothetical protein FKV78_07755 [Weissella paramesenteroides]KAA8459074.1 hypothetical protein FKV82_05310 [Weissella paramesenteroides]KAA8463480.1 hypothetical protein FKV85_04195 [Weissella paramesenteroides]KAA8465531.1 hypothetical protein FKV83_03925 [Weissella paramesenteroides]